MASEARLQEAFGQHGQHRVAAGKSVLLLGVQIVALPTNLATPMKSAPAALLHYSDPHEDELAKAKVARGLAFAASAKLPSRWKPLCVGRVGLRRLPSSTQPCPAIVSVTD